MRIIVTAVFTCIFAVFACGIAHAGGYDRKAARGWGKRVYEKTYVTNNYNANNYNSFVTEVNENHVYPVTREEAPQQNVQLGVGLDLELIRFTWRSGFYMDYDWVPPQDGFEDEHRVIGTFKVSLPEMFPMLDFAKSGMSILIENSRNVGH